jgi:signal transduction histidine kinase
VSFACITFISLVSILLGRSVIARLNEIYDHLLRFGKGDFSELIEVSGRDEISTLGHQINVMASRIQSLLGELEAFSYSIAHDLRAPLRSMAGFSTALLEDHAAAMNPEAKSYLERIVKASQRMGNMVDGLLNLSRLNRSNLRKESVDLTKIAKNTVDILKNNNPERKAKVTIEENLTATCDPQLMDIVILNLIGNAWKFTKQVPEALIHLGLKQENGAEVFYVSDNGAGFDMRYADKLFGTFQRLHKETEFEGHGIGLATVKNIVQKHGGRIWVESEQGKGTTFYFTLG